MKAPRPSLPRRTGLLVNNMPKHVRFIAKKEAKGPGPMHGEGRGAGNAIGRGMFPPRKAKTVKNNKPVAKYSGKA